LVLARAGVPVLILPMPLAGTTSPITALGTSVVLLAELLSAVVLFQLAKPGCRLISGVGAGVADMRTGLYLAGTPECGLVNIVGIEMSRFYGLPVLGSAGSGDAKVSNHQAGAEAMMMGLACALSGADTMLAFGLVDGAQSVSLATTVLDCDTVGAIKRIVHDQEVGAAEALVDDLVEVGIGGHFLARRSTRERSRAGELWRPRRWQREVFEQYAGRSLVAEAAAEADELLATHEVPPLADDVAAEVDAVIERYARAVGAPDDRVRWRDER